MKIRFLWLLPLMLSVSLTAPSFAAGDRFALVIGNAKYPDADTPLKEPVNDARRVAAELKRDGFAVEIGEDLTSEGMRAAFDRLYGKIKPGSVALLFFSGFGIQSARQSYLIPVDAQIWTEADVRRDGFNLEAALGEIDSRGAGVKIALVDASWRNPFERRFRSVSAGLAPAIAPGGSLVMYSTAPGSVISDVDNSLFVQELLKQIRVSGLAADETLNRTRLGVARASGREQVPWISSSLAEDFSFIPGESESRPATGASQLPEPAPTPVVADSPPAPSKPEVTAAVLPPPAKLADTSSDSSSSSGPTGSSDGNDKAAVQPALADDPTIKTLTAQIAANPADVNALNQRGQIYASKGAYSLAIRDFDDALRIDPKNVDGLNNRCWTRAVTGDLQNALKDCNTVLRLRPRFAEALDSRGLVHLKSGAVRRAAVDFDRALRLNPHLASSLYGRGLARQRNRSPYRAALDIANAKAMDPDIAQKFASYGIH